MDRLDAKRIDKVLGALGAWCREEPRIRGLAIVGSWDAVDRQHAEADLDLVLLVESPDAFRLEPGWMAAIDWSAAGLGPGHWSECDYGAVCSRHLSFEDGAQIEVSFVGPEWAATDPVHPTARRMAGNGMRVVHDPDGQLGKLTAML
jgi:hypothetical protein